MTEYRVGAFPLILRPHPRAKYLKLRFDARSRTILLTLPPGVSNRKALQFAQKHHDWIQQQNDKSPDIIPLIAGQIIPFRGRSVKIIHRADDRAAIKTGYDQLIVGGPRPGFEIRLYNWLKKQARHAVIDAVETFSPTLGHRPARITIRDSKSRWGSCSHKKNLSFSWRLILAPDDILRYVVAHEMAHLGEMNHGPAFWALVENLFPDWKTARRWLKSDGNKLMLIG
ncbi:MAG: M48 family metallopeptidase [Alphaproteobacteria bacterium]|nr:M48 family metallopeptidase [Alphaproteobacteria bacterium]